MARGLRNIKNVRSWYPDKKYVSASDENQAVIRCFNGKQHGYLVDLAAADGVTGSNSFKLIDEYHWSGLLVEPCPKHHYNLKLLYDDVDEVELYFGAVHREQKSLMFHELPDTYVGMSYTAKRSHGAPENCPFPIIESYNVPAENINNILENANAPNKIDFFNLDIEGAEHEVLDVIDMEKYDIELWCIEKDTSTEILYGENVFEDFFYSNGYEKINFQDLHISPGNNFWRKKK